MKKPYDFQHQFSEPILKCSQCGFCRAVCPVFGVTLRPSYNARGKMLILKEVLDKTIDLGPELIETLFQCTTCGNCAQNCPSGVNVPEIIKTVRRDMARVGKGHPTFDALNHLLCNETNIYGEKEPQCFSKKRNQRADHVFFVGCVGNYREDESTEETIELLDRIDIDYTMIDEVCCSGVLEDVGHNIVEHHAKKNIKTILATGAHTVITGCPYCFRTFQNKPQYAKLRDEGINIVVLSQFLKAFDFAVSTEKKVTYHDPCDLGRHCGIFEEPREVIRKIAPKFVEMPNHHEQSICCGAGGGVRGAFAKNSILMARERLKEVEQIGADVVLTDCNSCAHNLRNAQLRAQKFRIYTIAAYINHLLEAGD